MLKLLLLYSFAIHFVESRTLRNINYSSPNGEEEILVIDTDAGADDAMAISLVLNGTKGSNPLVAGITCVRGNTGLHNVTKNVLRTLKVNGRLEIPVMAGSDFGLIGASPVDDYFGEDGFGDFNFPVPDVPLSPEHPAVFLSNIVRQNPGKVTILAQAPLTNLAIAGQLYADFYRDVRQIIFLGGSTSGHGNMNGVEFNIWADPAAARAVFIRSPIDNPITIIPCETLRSLRFSWDWRKYTLGTKNTSVINFLNLAERKMHENPKGWKVDDPAAAAVYLYPEIVMESFFGRSKLSTNGSMTVDRIDGEPEIPFNAENSLSEIVENFGYVKVVGSVNGAKLKQILFELL